MKKILLLLISMNFFVIAMSQTWLINGNIGTNTKIHFVGTTDDSSLVFRIRNFNSGIVDSLNRYTCLGYKAGNGTRRIYVATTAFGYKALGNNLTVYNTAVGTEALRDNPGNADGNTAIGNLALSNNIRNENVGIGGYALNYNVSGYGNVGLGYQAGYYNSTGRYNTAVGMLTIIATYYSNYNIGLGYYAGGTQNLGANNIFLGANTRTNGSNYYNCIAIGQDVTCTAVNQARIGNAATSSIGGYANWTNISDSRFKKDIQSNVPGLDFILKLNPVTYHLDVSALSKKLGECKGQEENKYARIAISEKEKIIYTGFLAQEVETAAKQARYDFSGIDKPKNEDDLYGLRYDEFVVPLVKAVQQQQQKIEKIKKEIAELKEQNKIIKEVTKPE